MTHAGAHLARLLLAVQLGEAQALAVLRRLALQLHLRLLRPAPVLAREPEHRHRRLSEQ